MFMYLPRLHCAVPTLYLYMLHHQRLVIWWTTGGAAGRDMTCENGWDIVILLPFMIPLCLPGSMPSPVGDFSGCARMLSPAQAHSALPSLCACVFCHLPCPLPCHCPLVPPPAVLLPCVCCLQFFPRLPQVFCHLLPACPPYSPTLFLPAAPIPTTAAVPCHVSLVHACHSFCPAHLHTHLFLPHLPTFSTTTLHTTCSVVCHFSPLCLLPP